MGRVKDFFKYIILKEKSTPERYIEYLRSIGCRIGEGTKIFASPRDVLIDITRPFLIEIGKNVQITRNVTILTHGYDWSVLKGVYGEVLGSSGKVKIGNNVFIGMNSTILKDTTIGDNVIIGANSLVRGHIPSNSVIAGNPAKIICNIEEYYTKRKSLQLKEAKELANEYYSIYKKIPPKEVFFEFFWLFENREKILNPHFDEIMRLIGNYELTLLQYKKIKPIFKSYEDFIENCEINFNYNK